MGNAEPLSQLARRLRFCGHQPEEVERVEVDEVSCEERDERRVHPPVQPPHALRPQDLLEQPVKRAVQFYVE